jgi:hypothetical protein
VFRRLAVLHADDVEEVVLVGRAVLRILRFAFPHKDDVGPFRELDHWGGIERRLNLARRTAAEHLHERRTPRADVRIVLNVVGGHVLLGQLGVPRLEHFTPPVGDELEVRLLLRRHRLRLREGRRHVEGQREERGAGYRSHKIHCISPKSRFHLS